MSLLENDGLLLIFTDAKDVEKNYEEVFVEAFKEDGSLGRPHDLRSSETPWFLSPSRRLIPASHMIFRMSSKDVFLNQAVTGGHFQGVQFLTSYGS